MVGSELDMQYYKYKNTLLQTAFFSAILMVELSWFNTINLVTRLMVSRIKQRKKSSLFNFISTSGSFRHQTSIRSAGIARWVEFFRSAFSYTRQLVGTLLVFGGLAIFWYGWLPSFFVSSMARKYYRIEPSRNISFILITN